jgi:hypothetical protein
MSNAEVHTMHAVHTRQSLLTRILETQRQAAISRDERPPRPRKPSFSERYRGTEFETISVAPRPREPLMAPGRAFVLLAGAAAIGLIVALMSVAQS